MARLPGMTETPETPEQSGGLSRKRFLQAGAVTAGSLYLGAAASGALAKTSSATTAPAPSGNPADMNMIIFMTDQERYIQHFPPAWSEKNLPGLTMLQKNGLTFTNATTNACMCSPARSTFFSGRFPAQTGVKYTLETDMYGANYPQVDLPFPSAAAAQSVGQTEANPLPNIAQVMADAGYYTVYKGKWHCSKYPPASAPADANTRNAMYPPQPTTEPVDMLLPFGWYRWNPEDAGADQSIPQMGAGLAANDDRYMASVGDYTEGTEGVLQFIKAWPTIRQSLPANQQRFCLIVSIVNPHDVLGYPKNYAAAGFSNQDLQGDIGLPATWDEDLSTKPRAQELFLKLFQLSGRITKRSQRLRYLNFYGNLMKSSDAHLLDMLAALKSVSLVAGGPSVYEQSLIIRTADHGEVGLAHGGLRQKNFNMYDESLRIPLVYSNPGLFPKPRTSSALVSHVDMVPTLASLVGATQVATSGVDYSGIVLGKKKAVQDYVLFTYDDFQAGQNQGPYIPAPQHIVGIREARWKIGKYYSVAPDVAPPEFEMYCLQKDPLETTNLAYRGYTRTPEEQRQFVRLLAKLNKVQAERLQPLPSTIEPPMPAPAFRSGVA